jgi:hypothetical protein
MSCTWSDHPNNVWWKVQVKKLLTVMQLCSAFWYFITFRSRYGPQHPVLKHPVVVLHLMWEIRLYTHTELTNSVAPEPEDSSTHSQQPADGPDPEPGESSPHPQPISLRSLLIPSSHLIFGRWFFLGAFPPKPCTSFIPLPCVPHALPTSFSLIWSA